MTTYSEKLKDPRWQKKRLKVLERDDWTCQCCSETKETLHVHHKKYAKSGNPWDSPMKDLKTLCEGCHDDARKRTKVIKDIVEHINAFTTHDVLLVANICTLLAFHKRIGSHFLSALFGLIVDINEKSKK